MQEVFFAPVFSANRGEPHVFVSGGQIQSLHFGPVAFHIVYFEEEHGVVDPILHARILQVEAKSVCLEEAKESVRLSATTAFALSCSE